LGHVLIGATLFARVAWKISLKFGSSDELPSSVWTKSIGCNLRQPNNKLPFFMASRKSKTFRLKNYVLE